MSKCYVIALYIRLSVEDNRGEIRDESDSISNQRDLLMHFVESSSEFEEYDVIEFCDDGFSGTGMERSGVQALLKKARTKEVDCIIVKDFSRFGRDYITVSDYVDQIFPFLGVRFISVNDHYDSVKMQGKTSGVNIAFRNVIYSYYSKDLSMKVKSGNRVKAEKGKFLSPFAPIGYRKSDDDKNRLVVDKDSAGIVRRIFRLAGMGMSVREITCLFNDEKVPTPSAIKNNQGYYHKWWEGNKSIDLWAQNMIIQILRDERYLGKTVYGKRYRPQVGNRRTLKNSKEDWIVVEKQHEPLVTEQEFQEAQDHLSEYMERELKPAGVYLFTHKLLCGHCGCALTRRVYPATIRYMCRTKYRVNDCGCMEGSIEESEITDIVLTSIQTKIKMIMDEKNLLIKAGNTGKLTYLQKKAEQYQSACAKIDEQKAELYDAMAEGEISRENYKQEREVLSKEQEYMIRQIKVTETELMDLRSKLAVAKQDETKLMKYLQMDGLTRQMIMDFVDCIYVYNCTSIHIRWNFCE